MGLKIIDEANLEGQKVLARFDFNVPLGGPQQNGQSRKITDTTRIDLALATIRNLLEQKVAKLILMSHLGRPKGEVRPELSLEPVATYLAEQLGEDVVLAQSAVGAGVKELLSLKQTRVVLLENLRFHPEEEMNDDGFCQQLAQYGDAYVNDAFGAAHRKHASTYGIVKYFPRQSYSGLLLKREIQALGHLVERPTYPFVAVMGGAKVSDKMKAIERLLPLVQKLLIGGAMAYPFLKAQGRSVGKSLCSDKDIKLAKDIFHLPTAQKVILPQDHIVATSPDDENYKSSAVDIDDDLMGLDIGPRTRGRFARELEGAKTIFWNGPMGLFEKDAFAQGTLAMAKALASSSAFTVVGGGDSVNAVQKSGVFSQLSHVSTGGGASLEFIENGQLPGINALKFGVD